VQHDVVVSEVRTRPGPTHSVFDVLSATVALFGHEGRVALLGFAGGGMLAPLQAMGHGRPFDAVDLDRGAYLLFRDHCPRWSRQVRWHHGDAAAWLQVVTRRHDLLIEDLSVPEGGDVFKPEISWSRMPALMRRRLARHGIAVFNLLKPAHGRWEPEFSRVAGGFRCARSVELETYENRILITGDRLPSARRLSVGLKSLLRGIGSRMGDEVRVRTVKG
jgi:spermidine synthase